MTTKLTAVSTFLSASIAALTALAGCASSTASPSTRAAAHTTAAPTAAPVTWFSLPADDPEAAAKFYRSAFGWTIEPLTKEADHRYDYNVIVDSPSDPTSYTPAQPGRVNGCIVKRSIGISGPVVLVEVTDLDRAARDIVAAGGTVASGKVPMRSLNGEFLLAKDPEGNMLEVFRSLGPPGR